MSIKLDISEAVALLCFMGDAIHLREKDNEDGEHDEELRGDKILFNGIAIQVNAELPEGDEHYSLYPDQD